MANRPTFALPSPDGSIAAADGPTPEFIRLPKPRTLCPWTGLSRSKLNELILPSPLNGHRPPVRSVSLRNRGQIRAVRLINFASLMAYLRSLEVPGHDGGPLETTVEAPDFPPAHEPLEARNSNQMATGWPRTGDNTRSR